MAEWVDFPEISRAKGMYLYDKNGIKMIDGVASMWCNVWGHSKKELVQSIIKQSKKLQHAPMFNLTNSPAEELAIQLCKIAPGMHKVFFSDNGSTAMEIAFKIALQYWTNIGTRNKKKIATLENGYHGDTFGAMSVGYVPEFFSRFKSQLFTTKKFSVPNKYRIPKGFTFNDYQEHCLDKIEKKLANDQTIAAFVMESGAQMAGGVIIYPKNFQTKIGKICKKFDVLFVLDEIATGFGRLGSMAEYTSHNCKPDIVSYGKMLTGGYTTMAATLTTKKIYDSFLGDFYEWKHLFHGHTYTGNPIAAAVSLENIKLYKKYNLIKKIESTSKIFNNFTEEILDLDRVGDVRHKGMLMGIELVKYKNTKITIKQIISINKIFFEEGRKHGVYFRTLGNIIMLVPPLAITKKDLELLLERTIRVIKKVEL